MGTNLFETEQDPVFQGSRLACCDHNYGRSALDRTFVLADAAPDTSFKVHIRQLYPEHFPVRSGNYIIAKIYGLRRGGAEFFTDDTGTVS